MSLRGLVVAAVVLAAGVLAWQKQEGLQSWFRQARSEAVAGAQSVAQAATSSKPAAGGLRKCVQGQQVSYTNVACPAGHKEQAVAEAAVTVLPAPPVAKPAEAGSAPSSLHEKLGLTRDDRLKDKIMERAIEGPR